jgi:aromatic ring-opening dioxygenase catalytic subunit (LigB family)
MESSERTPLPFISHGAPTVALAEDDYAAHLRALGPSLGEPRAIVIVSAHWQTRGGVRVTGSERPETIHDFSVLIGSGGAVHNLRSVFGGRQESDDGAWAREFDAWVRAHLDPPDLDALMAYRERAPHPHLAHPTTEHFDPLLIVAGASDPEDRLIDVHEGFAFGTLSMRCFAFSPFRPGSPRAA